MQAHRMSCCRKCTGVLVAGCLFAAACSGRGRSVHSVLYDPANPLPPRPADAEVQLLADQTPECPYEAIGTIAVQHHDGLPPRETTDAMARETRRIGGDGVMRLAAAGGVISGTAFRFTNPSCTR